MQIQFHSHLLKSFMRNTRTAVSHDRVGEKALEVIARAHVIVVRLLLQDLFGRARMEARAIA